MYISICSAVICVTGMKKVAESLRIPSYIFYGVSSERVEKTLCGNNFARGCWHANSCGGRCDWLIGDRCAWWWSEDKMTNSSVQFAAKLVRHAYRRNSMSTPICCCRWVDECQVKLGVVAAAATCVGGVLSVLGDRYSVSRKFDCRRPGWLESVFGPVRIRLPSGTCQVHSTTALYTHL